MASTLAVPVTTEGWSAVGSYRLVLNERWETNVMASYLTLDITLPRAAPSMSSARYAANLIWKPSQTVSIGAEVGYVDGSIEPAGQFGVIRQISASGLAAYLFASVDF